MRPRSHCRPNTLQAMIMNLENSKGSKARKYGERLSCMLDLDN